MRVSAADRANDNATNCPTGTLGGRRTHHARTPSQLGQWARVVALLGVGFGIAACGAPENKSGTSGQSADDVGSVRLAVQLAGTSVASASYTITGPGGFVKTATLNVAQSSTLSTVIGGIPAGNGFVITLGATSVDGALTCAGSATFNVTAHMISAVTVHLLCHEGARTGGVAVTGTVNICPVVDGVSANPAEVVVGFPVALSVAAHDSDNAPTALTYHWTVSSGSLNDASLAAPTFTCLFPGPATITVAVSDGDPAASCADSSTIAITCTAAPAQIYAWTEVASVRDVVAFYASRATDPMRWYKSRVKFDDVPPKFRGQVNVNAIPYNRRPGDVPALDDHEIDDIVAFLRTLTDAT